MNNARTTAAAAAFLATFLAAGAAAPGIGAQQGGVREGGVRSVSEADVISARFWLERAGELLEPEGISPQRIAGALSALDKAKQFTGAGSDYWYLRALAVLRAGPLEAGGGAAGAPPGKQAGSLESAAAVGSPSLPQAGPVNEEIGFVREAYSYARRALRVGKGDGFDSLSAPRSSLGSSGAAAPGEAYPGTAALSAGAASFERRALLFAELSLRLKEYRAYLEVYDQWPPGESDDVRLLYAAARSALYLGLDNRAAGTARRGEALVSPGDSLLRFGERFTDPRSEFRALAAAAGDAAALEGLASARRRWGEELERALEPWILSGRIALNRDDELNSLIDSDLVRTGRSLAGAPPVRGALIPQRYSGDLSLVRRLIEPDALTYYFAGFSGTLIDDSNYDGFPEEHVEMVNGRALKRRIDADQDGRDEWEILYDAGKPVRIRMNTGRSEGALTVNYDQGAYPEVISMVSRGSSVTAEAFFAPGRFSWDPSGGGITFGRLRPPSWNDAELMSRASRITVTADAPEKSGEAPELGRLQGEAVTWLESGYPVRALEMRCRPGERGSPIWIRELIYEDGQISAGRRSFRARADNPSSRIWELYERYEDGRLTGLAWDPGMTGSPSYLKDWALKSYLEIQAWDIDADGWMDARRFLSSGDKVSSAELFITEASSSDLLPWRAGDWRLWE